MSNKRYFIKVSGIVQGVGFRPYVYNLAVSKKLKGWVNNNSEGVYIDLQGEETDIEDFLNNLEFTPPPLSRIEKITKDEKPLEDYKDFSIKESEKVEESITLISPDMAVCEDCVKDILDPANRRYKYPFTNCTNCGPRFSIIKEIPYDRDKTTMKKFVMCKDCSREYKDPANRRFHAQPNACDVCGPHLFLQNSKGEKIEPNEDVISFTAKKLLEGNIFAIKGLTGFHLVCDAKNSASVKLLRERKRRPFKPFAVMAKNMDVVKKYCNANETEEKLLNGIRKPIVLLSRNENYDLPEEVAPNQNTLGVMFPYTPLHKLLFEEPNIEILIATSANVYGLPLEYENQSAFDKLNGIVDYFLMHDRDIYIPVDDSVVRVIDGETRMIRRARGYAPEPDRLKDIASILACGPNMKNTFAIAKAGFVFLSQHIGDLENLETIEHYERNIEHFKKIFLFAPEHIACDMHPDYSSTEIAKKLDIEPIQVQHHHAHIVSCMTENAISDPVIGISFDGTGFGSDGKIWGGEFLISTLKDYKRAAHLKYVPLLGGDASIREPYRIAISYLNEYVPKDVKEFTLKHFGENGLIILNMLVKKLNTIETSSMGRFFDAVSSIIGIRDISTYEGQASIELESAIDINTSSCYSYNLEDIDDEIIINPKETICEILKDLELSTSKGTISAKFHNTIINLSVEVCILLREKTGINKTALSGGVFQNAYILSGIIKGLESKGFDVYSQKRYPSNDGGVSLGQIIVANEKIKNFNE